MPALDWYRNGWAWVTLNGVIRLITADALYLCDSRASCLRLCRPLVAGRGNVCFKTNVIGCWRRWAASRLTETQLCELWVIYCPPRKTALIVCLRHFNDANMMFYVPLRNRHSLSVWRHIGPLLRVDCFRHLLYHLRHKRKQEWVISDSGGNHTLPKNRFFCLLST